MTRRMKIILALGAAVAVGVGGASAVYAQDASAQLRATGQAGEQADGYMGVVGNAPGGVRAQVEDINIKRRAAYTQLATRRGVKIEEAAASTACEIFATRVQPGQYYRLPDGVWRKRDGNTPIPRPSYCG